MVKDVDSILLPVRQALSLQYQQAVPLRSRSFLWPTPEALVQILPVIEDDLLGPSSRGDRSLACPMPPHQYRKSFFKQIISRLQSAINQAQQQELPEAEDLEIPEGILETYTELVSAPPIIPPSHSADHPSAAIEAGLIVPDQKPAPHALEGQGATTYFARYLYPYPNSNVPFNAPSAPGCHLFHGWGGVTVPEESAFVSEGTTGLQTWEASLRLASHLLANQNTTLPKDSRVLEIGAGAGFLATLCTQVLQRAGGGQVLATDVASNVLSRLAETRRINSLGPSELQVEPLDFWDLMPPRPKRHSSLDDPQDNPPMETSGPTPGQELLSSFRPTLILAADVVFNPAITPALVHTLRAALQAGATETSMSRALVASTQRNEATYGQFLEQLGKNGLSFQSIDISTYRALVVPGHLVQGEGTGTIDYACFPTAHVPERDGVVQLLEVALTP